MIVISKRKYYCNYLIAACILGVLVFIGTPIINKEIIHISLINDICRYGFIIELSIIVMVITIKILINKGLYRWWNKHILLKTIEDNLISIGAYSKKEGIVYVELPKIKIKEGKIVISLKNLKIRAIMEKYLDSFSTALPERYIVEDYYITQDNASIIIEYEDIKNYKSEMYSLEEYKAKIEHTRPLELYFDQKHIVNLMDYPHFLLSGSSGSGKSYLAQELIIQAIIKKWEVVILDIKRSYGLFKAYTEYYYETDDIMEKLKSIEAEMSERMARLQPELDRNPRALAVDIGYKPKLVLIEEYISLQSALDKKQKEELERIVKNLSVLARQSNIHIIIVMQAAGTENIQATTRSNLIKVLLGNAQSNIMTATFGTGVDIPNVNSRLNKGEGLIQLDRITVLRVPQIPDIDRFKDIFSEMPLAANLRKT